MDLSKKIRKFVFQKGSNDSGEYIHLSEIYFLNKGAGSGCRTKIHGNDNQLNINNQNHFRMKKYLRFLGVAMLATAALPAAAQTEDSPQVIVEGENVAAQGTTYFTYTASENALMKLDGLYISTYSEPVNATGSDGETWTVTVASSYNEYTAFYVESGVTYTFSHAENYGDLTFTMELMPVLGSVDGESCADPMIMPESGFFMFPLKGDYYSAGTIYVKYTAPFDGKLKVLSDTGFQLFEVGESCDTSDWTSYEYNFTQGKYAYSLLLDEGESVIMRIKGTYAAGADIMFDEVVLGATCEDAFPAQVGENVLPAAAGVYYYSITTPSTPSYSTFEVSSAAANCSVHMTSGCDSEYTARDYDSLSFRRTPVSANSLFILKITKSEDTAADESFEIRFVDLLPIEDSEVGETIDFDKEVTTPGTGNSDNIFYYSFTVPEGDPKLCVLESDAPDLGYSGPFVLTERGVSYPNYGRGANIKSEVQPGVTYLITVNIPKETPNGYKFKVTLEDMQAGQTPTYSIKAVIGENDVPDFTPVYFTYVSDVDRYVAVKTDIEGATLKVQHKLYGNYNDLATTTVAEGEKFECTAGKEYLFVVDNVTAAGKLILTEIPYGPGESYATAITAEAGTVDLPDGPSKVWYKLESPIDGFFTFLPNLPYYYDNSLIVYDGEVSQENAFEPSVNYDSYPYFYQELKVAVTKGQTIYVVINNTQSCTGNTATFGFAEAAEGEIPSKAIKLDFTAPETKVSLKKATEDAPVWYSIDLPEGVMSMLASSTLNAELYSEDNLNNYIASGGWISSTEYGISKAIIAKAGTYMIRVTSNPTDGLEATITVRDPLPGETPATAYPLDLEKVPYELPLDEINDTNPVWYSFNVHAGDLNIIGNDGQYWTGMLFDEANFSEQIGEISSAISGSSYNYGIRDVVVEKETTYYINVISAYSGTVLTFSGSAIEPERDFVNVNVEVSDGQSFSYTAANHTSTSLALTLPENWVVESCKVNGEAVEDPAKLALSLDNADQNVVFTLAYGGEIVFIDSTVGMKEIDAAVRVGVVDGKIRIEGTSVGDNIAVYNLGGMLMASYVANDTAVEIELPAGTYVVTVNGSAAKVLL